MCISYGYKYTGDGCKCISDGYKCISDGFSLEARSGLRSCIIEKTHTAQYYLRKLKPLDVSASLLAIFYNAVCSVLTTGVVCREGIFLNAKGED